jgi:hypothetical protein
MPPLKFGPAALSTPPADASSVEVTNRETNEPAELTSDVEVLDHGQVTFTVAESGRYLITTTNGPVRSSRKVILTDDDDEKNAEGPVVLNADGENLGLADRRAATDEHREPALQGHREPSGIEELELESQAAAAAVSARPEATPAEEADKVEDPEEEEGTPLTEEEKARLEDTEAKSDPDAEDPETAETEESDDDDDDKS